ncbi:MULTISPECIES: TraB/GumN family protein [Vibrio]|uniref:TraB/GumN family protein n=2 Tax=Vibrio TaxID=662 RepID=A0A7X4LHA4_9VIBR|nr:MULTISPECIES: TraB/GumN family protein [Vibrio]MBF8999414.1 TraB/GumN family protein [Vibrio nitrifigilis]MZI91636.1 TraB/GumN family protein [Vibrio eleionomae]
MSLSLRLIASLLAIVTTVTKAEPLYWHISKGDLNIYVIGSVHVGNESMYPLPKVITESLAHGDGLITEADTRNANQVNYPPQTVRSDEVLTAKQLKKLDRITKKLGLNSQRYRAMSPWVTAISIQNVHLEQLGYQSRNGIDNHLIGQATKDNIPVIGLETLQFQINLLTKQDQQGKELLVSMLDEWQTSTATMQCLVQSWKAGDKKNLLRFAQADSMPNQMKQNVLSNRNQDWADKINSKTFLPNQNGHYVMVVGMLHLIGEGNVLSLLEKQGFKVERLNRSSQANCDFPK